MATVWVRRFEPQDALEVAALHARVFPNSQSHWPSQAASAAYFRELLFHNPWYDAELPSWVAEEGGRIVGFFGVLPRRMLFGERAIRVAIGSQFMVDPEKRRSLAALTMLRRYFSGPQELSITDGANEAMRSCWEAAGGGASPLHSLHWIRLLRPAQGLVQLAAARPALRRVGALAAPFAALADACASRFARSQPDAGLRAEELDARSLAAAMHEHRSAFALRPQYDTAALEWLLAQVKAKRRYGSLQGCLLTESGGRVAGWFLYYLNRSMSQVLQLGARRERVAAVLERLFEHARTRGAVAIVGRLEPHLATGLQGKRCLLQHRGIATLVHARDPSLLVPFFRGDALFTRLDGEWWTRFHGEDAPQRDDSIIPLPEKHKQKLAPTAKIAARADSAVPR